MSDILRAVLFNAQGSREMSFRAPFEALGNIHIVDEVCDLVTLRDRVRDATVDLIAIGLDDDKGAGFDAVRRIAQVRPNCGIIGISSAQEPTAIIRAMRDGCSQYVVAPIDLEDLRNAVSRIRSKHQTSLYQSKRFCVIGSAGGVGATTIACNLAMELAHLGNAHCALVDLNLEFGDLACAFDCSPTFSVADVCHDSAQIDTVMLTKALHQLPCGVSILARPDDLEAAREVSPQAISSMFNVLAAMFPFCVVDLPRAYDYVSAAALSPADRILIVTQLTVPMLRNAARVHRGLMDMGAQEDRIEIVLNRCKSGFERITPDDVETHFGRPVLAMIPNDYRRVQTSLDLGHPIVADAPNTPARIAIQKMARVLAGEKPEAAENPGLLEKLWNRK